MPTVVHSLNNTTNNELTCKKDNTRIYNTVLDKVKRNPQPNHYNYIIILSSYTAHLPPNLVGYIIFSIAVLVLNSGIWVGFVCLFFAVGQKQMSLLMDNLLFFIYKPFSTFSLQLSLSSPICFFLSDLKLLQNIQSSFYNMSVLSPYHLCLSPLLEEGNFNLSFTQ